MRALHFLTAIALVGSGANALAQEHKAQAVSPDRIQWGPAPPVLPKGAQFAVLSGDPGKKGPFTICSSFLRGTRSPLINIRPQRP